MPGDNVVVMLDAGLAAGDLTDPELTIYWGAYLGTPDEVLIAGRAVEVAAEIARTKRELARAARLGDGHLPASAGVSAREPVVRRT